MCEIEKFHLLFESRLFIFPSVNLQKWNLSRLYFLARSLKRWQDDMKVFSFLLSDFNFLSAKSIPSTYCCTGRFCSTHVRPNSFSLFNVDAVVLSPRTALVCKFITVLIDYSLVLIIVIKLMLCFPAPPEEVINHFSLHSHVKFSAKLVFFPLIFTIHIHLICHMWPILVWHAAGLPASKPHPPLQSQHIPQLPSSEPTCQIWAIPGHLAAFAPAEPHPTAAPRAAALMAQGEIWLSISIWHPWKGGGRGCRVWEAPHFDRKTSV